MTTQECGQTKWRQPSLSLSLRIVHPFELVVGAAFHAYFNDLSARKNISPHRIELGLHVHCQSGRVCAEAIQKWHNS